MQSSLSKRVKISGGGKILLRKSKIGHNRLAKNGKRIRTMRKTKEANTTYTKFIKKFI
ncbi:MAG: 50S ribosomal protein L35 [Candidatus Parcubacteria bacterium]|nr:50S ribosomal protein L35 [Candidatus Parcubacteria bacterium]